MLLRNRPAFTLPELLLSSAIVVLVFVSALTIYMMLSKIWNENLILSALSRETNIALERMVRGYTRKDGEWQAGIEEARYIAQPSEMAPVSSAVTYDDLNDQERKFYFESGVIYTENNEALLSGIESCAFTYINKMIGIDLVTFKDIGYKKIRFQVLTKVKPRNSS